MVAVGTRSSGLNTFVHKIQPRTGEVEERLGWLAETEGRFSGEVLSQTRQAFRK